MDEDDSPIAKTEILFVGVRDELVATAKALGIPTGPGAGFTNVGLCPFSVGDFICYPASPRIAYRVVYRLFSYGSETKPPRWILGIEKAVHPLEAPS